MISLIAPRTVKPKSVRRDIGAIVIVFYALLPIMLEKAWEEMLENAANNEHT